MAGEDGVLEPTERKVAVITGASSGLGLATALRFAAEGYNVVLAARRMDRLREAARRCEASGIEALAVQTDVAKDSDVADLRDQAVQGFGRIDVWVNNAGIGVYSKFMDVPMKEFEQVLDTNLLGCVHGSYAALSRFTRQGSGILINVSSVNAAAPVPYASAYVASKYAVRGFTESLRMEMQLEGLADTIHICNVMPASIDTPFFKHAANHTGRTVMPIEPVYDPAYVAKHIVKLARKPQREAVIGPAGKLFILQRLLSPIVYEKVAAPFVRSNSLGKDHSADTAGNVFKPMDDTPETHGGWRQKRLRADRLNIAAAAAAAALIGLIGLSIFKARKGRRN